MDLKTTIIAMLVLLAAVGVAAICAAVFFGKRYQDGGTDRKSVV